MSISYLEHGKGHDEILLFLHGFMGNKNDWLPIIEKLKSQFHCIAIDLPGHGRTPVNTNTSFNEIYNDLALFIKRISPDKKVNIIGYSLGGRIALGLIINFPSLFKRALLESCQPGIETQNERDSRYRIDKELFREVNSQKAMKDFLDRWFQLDIFGNIQKHKKYSELIEKRLMGDYQTWQKSLNIMSVGLQKNYWKELSLLSIPCLYISGNLDKKYTQIGERMKEFNPHIQHKALPLVAHNVHFEAPDAFLDHLKSFFTM